LEVIFVVLGVTVVGHWRACAKMPVANTVLNEAEDWEIMVLLGDVVGSEAIAVASIEAEPPKKEELSEAGTMG
jgi:hypothetical protein